MNSRFISKGKPMSNQTDALLKEFREESLPTRRVLERIPAEHLGWKPHPTSAALGTLAMHVATIPRQFAKLLQLEEVDVTAGIDSPQAPAEVADILSALQQSQVAFEDWIVGTNRETFNRDWRLCLGPKVLISRPRVEIVRTAIFNHRYHHRGQLTVYLRMLGVPVPAIYGPSGDKNPFQ
jgi:uncharacterized damage-inducible protein DinB